jgi:type II secretory pathway component PulF
MMTPEQIAAVAGFAVMILIALLNLVVPKFAVSAPLTKRMTGIAVAVLTVLVANQWALNGETLFQMLIAIAVTFGSYNILAKPIGEAVYGTGGK